MNKFIVFLVPTIFVATPALADMLYLKCPLPCGQGSSGCGAMDLAVDLQNRTVNNISATITPSSIDWATSGNNPAAGIRVTTNFHIDRVTGAMTQNTMFFMSDGSAKPGSYPEMTCMPDTPGQTKF